MSDDEHICAETDPNSEYECQHHCMLPKDHSGEHMVIFEWPREEQRRWK